MTSGEDHLVGSTSGKGPGMGGSSGRAGAPAAGRAIAPGVGRAIAPWALGLAGCSGPQSALDPAGRQAADIADLFWLLLIGSALVWVVSVALMLVALRTGPAPRWVAPALVWGGGILIPTVLLAALLIHALPLMPLWRAAPAPGLRIAVAGEQYWWRVAYRRPDGPAIASANEVLLPLGERTEIELSSPDVIHSFWIPSLAGKMDAIPGRINRLVLEPTRAGVFRGVCAEFCGESHAFMGLTVRVLPRPAFDAALAALAAPARRPVTPEESEGARLFLATGCGACHAVRGTPADGVLGPDLTHVGTRPTIAAGLLPRNPGTLAGWIAGAQALKPGNRMPSFPVFTGPELRALGAYLDSLR